MFKIDFSMCFFINVSTIVLSDPNNNNLKSVADKDTDDDNLPQKNVSYLSSENKTSNVEKEKKMEKVLQTKMETIKQTKVEMFMWIQIKMSVRTIVETFMKKHMEKSIFFVCISFSIFFSFYTLDVLFSELI
jgi:hypothetical protein